MAYFDQQNIQRRAQQPIGPSQDFMNPEQPIQGGEEQGQQGEEPQKQPSTPWDRTAFRDAWMSSGIRNVPDMQNWLKTSGWGQHVGVGGSKGDKFQLPGGEAIDAVYAAGLGGNKAGPQWTGAGNWQGGDYNSGQGQQGQMGPSPDMMQQWLQMMNQQGQNQQNVAQPNQSRTQQMMGMGQQGARAMKQSSSPYRQGLSPTQGIQQQQKMTGYQTKPLVPQQ